MSLKKTNQSIDVIIGFPGEKIHAEAFNYIALLIKCFRALFISLECQEDPLSFGVFFQSTPQNSILDIFNFQLVNRYHREKNCLNLMFLTSIVEAGHIIPRYKF